MQTTLRFSGLFIVSIMAISFASSAQTLNVTGSNISGIAYAYANDFIVPVPGFDTDTCDNQPQPLTPNWIGGDFGFLCDAHAREKKSTFPQSVTSSQAFTMVRVNGDNSQAMNIRWFYEARAFTNSLEGYSAHAGNNEDLTLNFTVSGLSPGTPVTVYYSYTIFGAGLTRHEDVKEDSVNAKSTLTINGTEVLNGTYDFQNPPGLSGWNNAINVLGSINTSAGANVTIDVSSDLWAQIELPGKPYAFGSMEDQSVSDFTGTLVLSLTPLNPDGNGNNLNNGQMQFSVDIGSDAELSDPQADNDEVFDPGDAYPLGGPLLTSGGANGVRDDQSIFGIDVNPTPPDPSQATAAPVGNGVPYTSVYTHYFDMDGLDNTENQISQLQYGPGNGHIAAFADQCIYNAEYIFVSYDDDSASHYVDPMGSIPVNSVSPYASSIYGKTTNSDEVVEWDFVPFYPTSWLATLNIYDEASIHPNMPPNPDVGSQDDDDVDALDLIDQPQTCDVWYFSPDHEAPGPNGNGFLNWGSIYEVQSGGGYLEVVNAITNLGLPDSVDVDAFEFAWVWDTLTQQNSLSLLFSVDNDDPMTSYDESGGLDPRFIYASFLDGTHFAYYSSPLDDDIDAISTYPNSLNGTPGGNPSGMMPEQENLAQFEILPNPFTYQTNFTYQLKQDAYVSLEIFDALGRKVAVLDNGTKASGKHQVLWNGKSDSGVELADGVYLCRLMVGNQAISRKIVKTY